MLKIKCDYHVLFAASVQMRIRNFVSVGDTLWRTNFKSILKMKKIACQLVKSIMQIKQMSLSVSCHLMILVCQNIFYRIGSKKFKLFE